MYEKCESYLNKFGYEYYSNFLSNKMHYELHRKKKKSLNVSTTTRNSTL